MRKKRKPLIQFLLHTDIEWRLFNFPDGQNLFITTSRISLNYFIYKTYLAIEAEEASYALPGQTKPCEQICGIDVIYLSYA